MSSLVTTSELLWLHRTLALGLRNSCSWVGSGGTLLVPPRKQLVIVLLMILGLDMGLLSLALTCAAA